MDWKQKLAFWSSSLIAVATLFVIVMHFQDAPRWPASRFGGRSGALALIPVCLLAYAVSCYYVNRWLHPIAFSHLRAALPRSAQQPRINGATRAATILGSLLTGTVSGAIVIRHFFQQGHLTEDHSGETLLALVCIPVCFAAYVLCFYTAVQWLRPGLFPGDHTSLRQPSEDAPATDPHHRQGRP